MSKEKKPNKKFKNAGIKVLMLGASRVGKTSLLACMAEATDKVIKNTELTLNGEPNLHTQQALKNMKLEFSYEENKSRRTNSYFIIDRGGTSGLEQFEMTLGAKNKKGSRHSITFCDVRGENVGIKAGTSDAGEQKRREELIDLFEEADVVMITIDSVYIMEQNERSASQANRIDEIKLIFEEYFNKSDENKDKDKLILFVPVKCEKYYHAYEREVARAVASGVEAHKVQDDRMHTLNDRIKKYYAPIINLCLGLNADGTKQSGEDAKTDRNISMLITPVLTMGNIEFLNFEGDGDAEANHNVTNMRFVYYFRDGTTRGVTNFPPYAPQFCEIPLIYTLLFQLAKIQKVRKNTNNFKGFFQAIWTGLRGLAQDEDVMRELEKIKKNLPKDDSLYLSEMINNDHFDLTSVQ